MKRISILPSAAWHHRLTLFGPCGERPALEKDEDGRDHLVLMCDNEPCYLSIARALACCNDNSMTDNPCMSFRFFLNEQGTHPELNHASLTYRYGEILYSATGNSLGSRDVVPAFATVSPSLGQAATWLAFAYVLQFRKMAHHVEVIP